MAIFTLTELRSTKRPVVIAGPCSAETREQTVETCVRLAATGKVDLFRAGVWKPRTDPRSFAGVGEKALGWLSEVKQLTGIGFGVEVANAAHVEAALMHGADMVWVGARTTVSPFAMQEVADALRGNREVMVLVKNPLVPDAALWQGAIDRVIAAGVCVDNVGIVHRGFSAYGSQGYRNPPMWHVALEMRQHNPDIAMICDPSHIAGRRDRVQEVAQKAADLSYDGLMIESHIDPDCALSDAAQQITPCQLSELLAGLQWRQSEYDSDDFISQVDKLREEIDRLDSEIFTMLSRRMAVADQIGVVKRDKGVTILQENRWRAIMEKMMARSPELGLSAEFIKTVMNAIHVESIEHQNSVMNK